MVVQYWQRGEDDCRRERGERSSGRLIRLRCSRAHDGDLLRPHRDLDLTLTSTSDRNTQPTFDLAGSQDLRPLLSAVMSSACP